MAAVSDTHILMVMFIVICVVVFFGYTMSEHISLFGIWLFFMGKQLRVRYKSTSYKDEQREVFLDLLNDQAGALSDMKRPIMMNSLIANFWPDMAVAVAANLRRSLEGSLDACKPGFLSKLAVQTCSCGTIPPVFEGMMIQEATQTIDNEEKRAVIMDMKMHWCGNPDIVLEVDGTMCPNMLVRLEGFSLSGLMRMKFYPLTTDWPLFTAMGIQFLSPPIINFNLRLCRKKGGNVQNSGLDIMSVPYLAPWLTRFLQRDVINNMMLFPKWLHFAIGNAEENWQKGYQVAIQGILLVRLVEGRSMKVTSGGKFRTSLFVGVEEDGVQSREVKQGMCPVWNEMWGLVVHGKEFQQLRVETQESGDLMGQGMVMLDKLRPEIAKEVWCNLNPLKKDGKIDTTRKSGQIRLQLLWIPVDQSTTPEEVDKRRKNIPELTRNLESGLARMREQVVSSMNDPDDDDDMGERTLHDYPGFLKPRVRRQLAQLLDQPPAHVFSEPQDKDACRRWKNLHSGRMTLDVVLSTAASHVQMEGALWKLNPPKTFTTWKQRYFVIVDDFMVYFASGAPNEKAAGCVYLRGAGVSQLEEIYGRRNAIRIMSCTPRRPNEKFTNLTNRHHFTLSVDNAEDFNKWLDAILERARFDAYGKPIDKEETLNYAEGGDDTMDGMVTRKSVDAIEQTGVHLKREEGEEGDEDDADWYEDWWSNREVIVPQEHQKRWETLRILSDPLPVSEDEDDLLEDVELTAADMTNFEEFTFGEAEGDLWPDEDGGGVFGEEVGGADLYAAKKQKKDKKKKEKKDKKKEKKDKKKDKLGVSGSGDRLGALSQRGPAPSSLGLMGRNPAPSSVSMMRGPAPSSLNFGRSPTPSSLGATLSVDGGRDKGLSKKKGSFFSRGSFFLGGGSAAAAGKRESSVSTLSAAPGDDGRKKSKMGLFGRRVSFMGDPPAGGEA